MVHYRFATEEQRALAEDCRKILEKELAPADSIRKKRLQNKTHKCPSFWDTVRLSVMLCSSDGMNNAESRSVASSMLFHCFI